MGVAFLTPLGGALAAFALVPLGVYLLRQRRSARIRAALGLRAPSLASRAPLVLGLAAVPALLALAAAQPVLERNRHRLERTDAEIWVVVDTSRSMLASAGPDSPTRFQRARSFAQAFADALPEVPIGLASLTDRVLPHSFPTTDRRVTSATLYQSIGIERPGPTISLTGIPTTSYDTLASVPRYGYFSPTARKRVLVVLTDGETRPLETDLAAPFHRGPRLTTILVHFHAGGERVYDDAGLPEAGYQPVRDSAAKLAQVAREVGGSVFGEQQPGDVVTAVRSALGAGPTHERLIEGERRALMPWVTLAAFLPLGLVLLRRNV